MNAPNHPTSRLQRFFSGRRWLVWVITALVVIVAIGVTVIVLNSGPNIVDSDDGIQEGVIWTCSMHPEIKRSRPGLCPKCQMPLIPMVVSEKFSVSDAHKALMEIETALVERKFVEAEIRMVGKIDYDETRFKYITAWIPGRLDRLYVDSTGVPVSKGVHLVELYSPELFAAQEELLLWVQAVKELKEGDVLGEETRASLKGVREKLRLWGLPPEQIADIEKRGEPSDHMTIYAPTGGIVIHKNAQEGMYVKEGARIYTIADLSQVWVKLDAYESDLTWLRYGQEVTFETVAYPGEVFTGMLTFIDPVLNSRTRTVKIRVSLPNADGRLKPEMFVKAIVHSRMAAGGKVMAPNLAGKWVGPMHPEIIKDAPGKCDICGMPLVRAEDLGYASADPSKVDKPLVVPATAVLWTGKRAVVYMQVDPALLGVSDVRDWPGLIARIQAETRQIHGEGEFINTRCPIMGGQLDFANVKAELVRDYQGRKVAFCCGSCPDQWDALAEPQKAAKLGAARDSTPLARLLGLFDQQARESLMQLPHQEDPPEATQRSFVNQINRILAGRGLYDAKTWESVTLPDEAKGLLSRGMDRLSLSRLTRLNRQLLEAIFPKALAKSQDQLTFEGRQIVLGPRAGDYYVVAEGLAEGERVVTRGAFKIDSALQIQAKPSMMSPAPADKHEHKRPTTKPATMPTAAAPALPAEFGQLFEGYFAIAAGLAGDSLENAAPGFRKMRSALETLNAKPPQQAHLKDLVKSASELGTILGSADDKDIEPARRSLALISEQMIVLANRLGPPGAAPVYVVRCSMAFKGDGASWLQADKQVSNPYLGSAMPRCGAVKQTITGPTAAPAPAGGHQHE